ncbi:MULTISPECIES: tRNA pseudouridine(55) synthase TruB [Streptococcus]|uniref:tRNA pseudouridine synthase B n=1 Tax=Streptococcus viridans TaxID=78535 RepID=A0A447Z3W0_9STRE|nr:MULTISPECIES: tRNA pseudouridine(55) synthase TruB [Streptococcus]VED66980.1 tRNA pseudouridine synthase B [Streptococcus viridans]VEE20039.1 tRNA pseudouridine synthase B [Streptococcus australis]
MNGIINLKKEAGMTSHDAVFKLRKILGTKKIGHGGTLDPDVVGVLPIAVGKATRMVEFMQDEGKVYEGEITLGYSTTTEDASGEVVAETPVLSPLDEKLVDEAIASLTGPITQIPPMYSAVKVNGRKLYEYARAGEEVERPVRQVTIYDFTRTSDIGYEEGLARFRFRVKCSKGTYIRTLSVDLGQKLGYAAHMSHLTRTSAAGLSLEDALTLEEVAEKVSQGDLSFLHPLEIGTGDLEKVELTVEEVGEVQVGRFIPVESEARELAAFYQEKLIAILEKREELYKPRKVFLTESVLQ